VFLQALELLEHGLNFEPSLVDDGSVESLLGPACLLGKPFETGDDAAI